jgi:uroporphyrinogen-III decarboxylase
MTGRERILAAMHGEKPDTIPFVPNIYQWFYYHQARNSLPAALSDARHPFDALRLLGADILARWDTQPATRVVYTNGEFRREFTGEGRGDEPAVTTAFNTYPPGTSQCRETFATPYGTLAQTWTYSADAGADFLTEYWWKSWDDFEAIRFLLHSTSYTFDGPEFTRWVERVAADGVVMVHITQSPLKTFHWLAGPENASLFLADHPEEMRELAAIHEEKALAMLGEAVDCPQAEVFVSLEDLDTPFYPPSLYRDYCDSFFRRAAELIHARRKILVAHACGHTRKLLPLAGSSGVDCLEGLTPPPMGDIELADARRLFGNPRFIVNGGMDPVRLQTRQEAKERLHEYTRALFQSMGDARRFLFASSCCTPVTTPWENLVHFRDAARQYGLIP